MQTVHDFFYFAQLKCLIAVRSFVTIETMSALTAFTAGARCETLPLGMQCNLSWCNTLTNEKYSID